ncbi:Uncharacterized protein YjbK [Evansella caseinilytica]|uniref:Uncharacterized protein YjbK n=1 Tax=Evansella caseinilytica TaxID=1503961 RepID=A0A1H3PIN5_9BACI|nr:CYTH domain-containing protein [Evansella caseinilytica]SDZ00259.1 Uncharacterized protein YjbK [Evansella caseinilytica]
MQEVEIEFKNILTEEEYLQLLQTYRLSISEAVRQTNYYFETADLQLAAHGSALRIRQKGFSQILTFKQPHEHGLLETHQPLNNEEVQAALNHGHIAPGPVLSQIERLLKKTNDFIYLGELTTDRLEKQVEGGLLVFDRSYYFDVIDYELELECSDAKSGQAFFLKLLKDNNIPKRNTDNKVKRFYDEKLSRSMTRGERKEE